MIHDPISEHAPTKEFSWIIEKTWFAARGPGAGPWSFEILPDGNFDLLFVLSESGCDIVFTGPYTKPQRIDLPDCRDYFCVRFRPGMMPALADRAAKDLVDSWVLLPKVLGVGADELGEKLLAAGGLAARTRVIESFFRKSGPDRIFPHGPIRQCTAAVDAAHGAIRVNKLARQTGMSVRTLERLFGERIGISPKTFIRNIRFQHALAGLKTGGRPNLAALACDCGYFDQSHLIKDFAALANRLPSAV